MYIVTTPQNDYKDFTSLKGIADYIKWLETFVKSNTSHLNSNFKCLKNWVQWQLKSENIEVDDGDIDDANYKQRAEAFKYQEENNACAICGKNCTKNNIRQYFDPPVDQTYSSK